MNRPFRPKLDSDEPSPKKSKRGVHKRVVSVPIGDVAGSKSRGESYPPSDSWAWRKYGQKPIKGSPYPRGYYRCSSSKGCPARKQVERSRVDPTTLIITYSSDHNHPIPIPSKSATTSSADHPSTRSDDEDDEEEEQIAVFPGESLIGEIAGEWFGDVASTALLESPIFGGDDVEADVLLSGVTGEDESLFGDLGELPEYAVVFRRRVEIMCGGSTG